MKVAVLGLGKIGHNTAALMASRGFEVCGFTRDAEKAKAVNVSKNKTTSKYIKKLSSKKKYYVRVRTYKKVKINGKTKKVYSSWSKTKTVKTR